MERIPSTAQKAVRSMSDSQIFGEDLKKANSPEILWEYG
jgi:hypothetical protein